jgi:glycerol-3-phosphate acyltransferase PlsX
LAETNVRIAVDAMGGDLAPAAVVEGALLAVEKLASPPQVILVGDEARVEAELAKHGKPAPGLTLHHAAEVVEMGEHPGQALRQKKESSIRLCFELMKSGGADAVVSAGNSGAVMAGAILLSGRLPHVERPAIGTVIPHMTGRALLIDAGANTDCKPVHLCQFGLMGAVYAHHMFGVAKPKIAILSNGEEPTKGNDLTRASAEALSQIGGDFLGYAEGKDLFGGKVDVLVCDGFTGNTMLKGMEGAAEALFAMMRQEIVRSPLASLGMLLARGALRKFRARVDWDETGGAPLIGVRGVGIVAHGRSGPKAIMNAIRVASEAAKVGLDAELSNAAKEAAELVGRRGAPNHGNGRPGTTQGAAEDASEEALPLGK